MKLPSIVLADRTLVKLPLETTQVLTIPVGFAQVTQALPMNYINGTGLPGSTSQLPIGLLNWANFYGAFRIVASKIRVEFAVTSASATTTNGTVPFIAGVFPSESWIPGTSPGTNTSLTAQPYCRYKTVFHESTGGSKIPTIYNFITSKKMAGQPIVQDNAFQQVFTYTAGNPVALTGVTCEADWILFCQTMDSSNITTADARAIANVKIRYYVMLEDRLGQRQPEGPPS